MIERPTPGTRENRCARAGQAPPPPGTTPTDQVVPALRQLGVVRGATVKPPAGNSRFTVRYTSTGVTSPITTRVVAGTFRTPTLLPGEFIYVQVWVKAKTGTPRGASITQTVTVTSVADPTKKDVVKYTATRGAC